MKRTFEEFVNKVHGLGPFTNKSVLEIGCGSGNYSRQIAKLCNTLTAIDPDEEQIVLARELDESKNTSYKVGSALSLNDETFDIVIFTLSLHHIPAPEMHLAIEEAVRVVRTDGHIIFLEPGNTGSFFDAEMLFDACDGDETLEKATALEALQNSELLQEIVELDDRTIFVFDSTQDFIDSLDPKQNLEQIDAFLQKNDMKLEATRRINIFKPVIN